MKLYRVRDWNNLYENNRTRELKKLDWFPMQNKQDGDGYTLIMEQQDGAAIFGAWVACAQIASRCGIRGTLSRDGATPHDAASLSRMSRIPVVIMQRMLDLLSSNEINWLEVLEINDLHCGCENPALSCENPATGCLEGKGREGKEEKGMERREIHPDSGLILDFLNEQSGRSFRKTDTNLTFISQRLQEPEVDTPGIKQMVSRQCALWKGSSMEEYLRPQTLFNKTKFDAYYGAKDMPVIPPARTDGKPAGAPTAF